MVSVGCRTLCVFCHLRSGKWQKQKVSAQLSFIRSESTASAVNRTQHHPTLHRVSNDGLSSQTQSAIASARYFIARDEPKASSRKSRRITRVNIKDGMRRIFIATGRRTRSILKGQPMGSDGNGGPYGMRSLFTNRPGDQTMRKIIDDWFADRFAEGATTKTLIRMACAV